MKRISTLAKRSATALVLLLGLIAGLGYLLAYAAERHPDRVAQWLSEYLGLEVRIGQLTVDWGLRAPSLRLDDVAVGDPVDPFHLARADVDFQLPGIFSASGPLRLSVYGSRFHVIREATGQWRVTGLPAFGTSAARQRANRSLRLRLIDASITWEDRKYQRAPLTFDAVSGSLWAAPGEWRIIAQARLDDGTLAFAGRLHGDPTGPDWGGYTRLHASDLDLAKLVGGYLPERYQLRAARVAGELQVFWQGAQLGASLGDMVATKIDLVGDRPFRLDRLATGFHFDRAANRWRLALKDLVVERAGTRWPATRVELASTVPTGAGRELAIAAEYLRLEDLVALARVRSPRPTLRRLMETLQPRGELRDLRLRLRLGGETPDWQAAARFQGLGVQRYGQAPGIDGLSGELRADRQHVQVEFEARDMQVDFGPLLRQPIERLDLAGTLDWQAVGERAWQLRSDALRIATPDISTQTRLLVTDTPADPLNLDIQVGFQDIDASRIDRYYPVDIMGTKLVAWLDRAIVGGTVTGGTMVLRGPARDFPFDKTRNGRFEVLFGVRDLILDYQRRWPRLEEMTADVRFHNNAVEIRVDTAKILNSDVQGLTAAIRQLSPVTPVEIRGEVRGPLADELRLLSESPLAEDFGNLVEGVRARGPVRLKLAMAVPLGKIGDYRLEGSLRFLNNQLTLVEWQLPLDDIEGNLTFDRKSVRASGIQAKGLGTQLTVDVAPGQAGATWVSTSGLIDADTIEQRLPALPPDKAAGKSLFAIRLEIPGLKAPPGATTWLHIQSDLKGMALQLPAPLGKRSLNARRLQVRVPVSGRRRAARMRYADQLDAVFDLDGRRGQIRFGGGTATLPQSAGIEVLGQIPRLDIDPWLKLMQALNTAPGSAAPHRASLRFDLLFADLLARGHRVSDLRLRLHEQALAWRGELDSPQITGRFSAPKSWPDGDLTVELGQLVLNFDPAAKADTPTLDRPAVPADARDWPSIDFRCRSLQVNKVKLADVELRMVRTPDGLVGTHLRFGGKLATFEGVLTWEFGANSNRSLLVGKLATPSLGKLLERLGYAPQLADTPADIDLDLNWPGAPSQIDQRALSGHIRLALGAGRFLDFDPGVTRVVGLLNLSALQRRLRLDFSDLFKRGFSFDEISGNFTLDAGDAYTNDFKLNGPSGRIDIAGRTGIGARDFDQLVSVTPKLDATLPIAGTIAGGPVAGLAAWVAQLVMREQVDRINRFQYSVKGPWADPKIVALSSGGTLSRLFGAGQTEPKVEGLEDHLATPNLPLASPTPANRPAQNPGARDAENGAQGTVHSEVLDEPTGSVLDRFLEKLAPTGSGREILDATE